MKFKTHLIATVLLQVMLLNALNTKAQINSLQSSFEQYQRKNLQEKLFVHTDKGFYLTGEILWLKVYDVSAATNKPLKLSKVAYVEVLDKDHNPVMQAKIALNAGSGNGSLYIPVNLSNGNYKLRAYTNWMKNYSADYYFEKQISIVNPLKSPDKIAKETAADFDIQFFPEGGNLIGGFNNKVAFRVVGNDGKGVSLPGAIINQRNDTIARFKPLMFGLGSFTFAPAAGDTYKAVFKNGTKAIIKNLPDVAAQGYAMVVTDNGQGQLNVKVNSSQNGESVYLFAHTGQAVSVAQSADLSNGTANFVIDKNKLDGGIVHLTLFNKNKQPVSERLYFKRPKQKLTIQASTDASYGIRKKVGIAFTARNQDGKPVVADLSIAVYRIDTLQKAEPNNIESYLWLTSDLRGNIESPSYYFNNVNAATDEALDNLMLTQGWRRFEWNKVLSNKEPAFKFLPEYNGHLITGKIFNNSDNTPAGGVVAYLGVPGKRVQMYTALSDSATGHLTFNTRDMYGAGEIVVQPNTERDSIYHIEIQSPFSDQYSNVSYPALQPGAMPQALLENYSLSMQVQNLYASARTKQFYDPGVDSSAFYFKPYKTYMLDDFTRFTTLEEVMREYVSEVNIVKPKNRFHIKTLNENGFLESDPLVILDGVPIFNTDKVMAVDPLKIKRLEVMRERYFYGSTINDGIFSFTTYKGDLGGVELDPHAVVMDYEGMQLQRKFYAPVYDTDSQVKSHMPDFRNVLYWLPNANTDATGKNQASFYTSDQPGKYIAVIQGITPNGEAGSGYVTFEVKK